MTRRRNQGEGFRRPRRFSLRSVDSEDGAHDQTVKELQNVEDILLRLMRRKMQGDFMKQKDEVNKMINDMSLELVNKVNSLGGKLISEIELSKQAAATGLEEIDKKCREDLQEEKDVRERQHRFLMEDLQVQRDNDWDSHCEIIDLQKRVDLVVDKMNAEMAEQSRQLESLKKDKESRDDRYWSRCIAVERFGAPTGLPHDKAYQYVRNKMRKNGMEEIFCCSAGFYICRSGNLRLEFRSKHEAEGALADMRRLIRFIPHSARNLAFSLCVPPRFMKRKQKLLVMGMKLKKAKLLENFEIRFQKSSKGVKILMLTIRKPSRRTDPMFDEEDTRPPLKRWYDDSEEDIEEMTDLVDRADVDLDPHVTFRL